MYIYNAVLPLPSSLRASQRDQALLDYVRALEQERAMLKEQLISAQVMLQQHLSSVPATAQGADQGSVGPTPQAEQESEGKTEGEIQLQVYD